MLFNSSEFIFVFLPFAVLLHFALARWSVTAAVSATTLTSLLFYAWWNPPFVLLPALSIAANFLIAQAMRGSDEGNARRLLIIGIVANLAVLGWFKYGDFLLSIVEGRRPNAPEVPLALSFTTFVQIAFLVDVWRRRDSVNFPAYAMFVAFFPHLIAGPIVRWEELGPQLRDRARYRPDWNNIALGLTIFCLGLAKKVLIADSLSPHVGPVFDAAARGEALTAAAAWGAAYAYTAQLYFDFSGYSDMAVGLGLLFNLRLPINFAAPLARDEHHRSVAALAYFAVALPARFRLRTARRRCGRAGAAHHQPVPHHGDRRPVARRELDVRAVGRISRRSARGQSCAGGSGADGAPRRKARASPAGPRHSRRSSSGWCCSAPPTLRRHRTCSRRWQASEERRAPKP